MTAGTVAAPACLPPRPTRLPSSFNLPRGAWDTHAHVIGGDEHMPFVANRNYTPPAQRPEDYVAALDAAQVDFGIVVQISVHGHDNSLIADALRKYPRRLRGVVSIDGTEPDEELLALRHLGVCGIRINEHFSGGVGADRLAGLAARCKPLGWHVDLGLVAARLRELTPQLEAFDVPIVIDHLGYCDVAGGISHPDCQAVLDLLRNKNVWIKLSGAYRLTSKGAPYSEVGPFYRAFYEAAPERCIWGADWPNVALFESRMVPEFGEQLDALYEHLGHIDRLHAVLVRNPLRLYGHPGTPVAL